MDEPPWSAELSDPALRSELDRLHPERLRLRPRDHAGVGEAMDFVEELWAPTLVRARRLPSEALHVRVAGEYSFVETQRHLLFAGDAWLQRMVLGVSDPHHPWGVAPDLPADAPPDTGPELDEVLLVRAQRAAGVRAHLAALSEADLGVRVGGPWDPPGLPPQKRARVIDCFRVVFREEWWHHQYAVRDLEVIEAG